MRGGTEQYRRIHSNARQILKQRSEMRRGLILIVIGLNLTGCRYLDRERDGRGSTEPASRVKPRPNDNWLDGPVANRGGKGASGPEAKDPNFDVARETLTVSIDEMIVTEFDYPPR